MADSAVNFRTAASSTSPPLPPNAPQQDQTGQLPTDHTYFQRDHGATVYSGEFTDGVLAPPGYNCGSIRSFNPVRTVYENDKTIRSSRGVIFWHTVTNFGMVQGVCVSRVVRKQRGQASPLGERNTPTLREGTHTHEGSASLFDEPDVLSRSEGRL